MAPEELELVVSVPPHIREREEVFQIMFWVILGLLPATLGGIYFFHFYAIKVIVLSILAAVATEALFQKARRLPVTINDGSAIVTGLLLALCLPPKVPWWIPVVGGFIAIFLGKQIFGGLGYNIFNPALVARAVLLLSWAEHMTKDWYTALKVDAIARASPLFLAKQVKMGLFQLDLTRFYKICLFGNPSGCIGEVSVLLLLIGGGILLWREIIDWRIPAGFIGSVAVLCPLLGMDPIFHVLAGGLILGAFFMATDYVTSPITPNGRLLFGIGCGVITILLRSYSILLEGVTYAILFMNACTPLIDKYIQPRRFGVSKGK
ncbi:MAG: RnfABCDGE type electron transport complex subunit D [Actinomycetota bacterium]|nr:RnfABCDGE type electron transport complex subunit D [Actinomycetota bacterium]MDI6821955.1 RnfABCDGE type electron transport complex subunit D [Actinomycetota bacterium]